MADELKNIKIILSLEGKDVVNTSIQLSDEKIKNFIKTIDKLKQTTTSTSSTMKTDGKAGPQAMSQALGQLGWAIGDADMFMVNFRMGMMSIANNVPMFVQGLTYAKQEAKSLGITVGQSLVQSLAGPGGLMVAVNGVMLLLNVLPGLFKTTTEEIKKEKEEIDKLKDSYKNLTIASLDYRKKEVEAKLAELDAKYPRTETAPNSKLGQDLGQSQKLSEKDRYGDDYETRKGLLRQNKVLDDLRKNIGVLGNLNNQIDVNRKKLTDANNNPDSMNYFANLVPGAKDLEDALKKINQWIDSDEKQINKFKVVDPKKYEQMMKKIREDQKEVDEYLLNSQEDSQEKELQQLDIKFVKLRYQTHGQNDKLLSLEKKYQIERKEIIQKYSKDLNDWLNENDPLYKNRIFTKLGTFKATDVPLGGFEVEKFDPLKYDKDAEQEKKLWVDQHKTAVTAMDGISAGFRTMWSEFAIGHRQAKDGWDAAWLSMKNTALSKLGEIVSDAIWDQLLSLFKGGGASKAGDGVGGGFFSMVGSFFSSLIPGLDTGGIVTKPTLSWIGERRPEAVIPLEKLYRINSSQNINLKMEPVILKQNGYDMRGVLKLVEQEIEKSR